MLQFLRNCKLHPFLISLYPLLALASWNYGFIIWSDVFRSFSVIIIIVTILLFLLYLIQRSFARASLEVSLISIFFFFYVPLLRWVFTLGIRVEFYELAVILITILCATIWIICLWTVIRSKKQFEGLTVFLNTASLVLITSLLLHLGWMDLQSNGAKRSVLQNAPSLSVSRQQASNQRPDIYYIILDGYTREDVFREDFSYDNSGFTSSLQSQGFFVANNSYSNYGKTVLSIASSLNFDYLTPVTTGTIGEELNFSVYREFINQNRVMQFLKQQGYEIIAIESGYNITEVQNSDLYVDFPPSINNAEMMFLENSFSLLFIENWIPANKRARLLKSFASLEELSSRPSPKFVFLHVLAMHSPFLFDRNGAPLDPGVPEYEGYKEQVLFINQLVQETVSTILENSENEPVIILQGDHGPATDVGSVGIQECGKDHFSILNAIRLPSNSGAAFYDELSPVNTFRLVFNTVFGTDLGVFHLS